MAGTILFFSWITKAEKKAFTDAEIMMLKFHEQHHRIHWWRLSSQEDERQACKYAFIKMRERGFSFKEIIMMELSYRIFAKYGLTLSEFQELMK